MATSSQVIPVGSDGPIPGHKDRLEQENRRGDGYSQRLPGPARSSEAERQFGWRPEYLQEAKDEAAEPQAVTPIFQPNCMILWTAEWCPSCKSMYPIAKILQAEGYTVYVLDLDKNKKLAKEMRIQAVPTTLIRRDGVEVTRRIGTVALAEIKRTLTKN
jgi:thioredoxin 1